MSMRTANLKKGEALRLFRQGEIISLLYSGEPLFCFYLPSVSVGGAVILPRSSASRDLRRHLEHIRSDAGVDALSGGVLKLIAREADFPELESVLTDAGLSLASRVAMNEDMEGFFYSESGRLRLAPVQTQTERPEKKNTNLAPARIVSMRNGVTSTVRDSARESGASHERVSANTKVSKRTRVLIVDDSKTMRQVLTKILTSSPDIEVVGEAGRPSEVEGLIETLRPDVMTLDINMPEMTGVELLKVLLPKKFIPTVMISSVGLNEGREVITAFEHGAVDYIQKPSASDIAAIGPVIHEKIIAAARSRRRGTSANSSTRRPQRVVRTPLKLDAGKLIAIGASTGGTEAIKDVFLNFPENVPPIVVVQHIPPYFSTAFANRLNELCPFEVREAKDGDELRPGLALIAPGGFHMEVVNKGGRLFARILDTEPVNRFKPSVDVLFRSVAVTLGDRAIGILMTGMGDDGARGLLEMKRQGARTIAQNEESCVVFGMPRAAIEMGAADDIRDLDDIADLALKLVA